MEQSDIVVQIADSLGRQLTVVREQLDSVIDTQRGILSELTFLANQSDTLAVRLTDASFDWNSFWNLLLSAVLVVATILLGLRAGKLGRAQMKLEQGRDDDRVEQATARRETVDRRIGALAYLVARQLTSWLKEPITGGPEGEPAEQLLLSAGQVDLSNLIASWAAKRSAQSDVAEKQLLEMVALAPDASEEVQGRAYEAFVRFFEGMNRINKAARDKKIAAEGSQIVSFLSDCVSELEKCLPVELKKQFVMLSGAVSVSSSVSVKLSVVNPDRTDETSEPSN